jgi:hypothetical protein
MTWPWRLRYCNKVELATETDEWIATIPKIAKNAGRRDVACYVSTFRVFDYLSFSVVRAKRAKISEAIQKRAITFDSDQPTSSK